MQGCPTLLPPHFLVAHTTEVAGNQDAGESEGLLQTRTQPRRVLRPTFVGISPLANICYIIVPTDFYTWTTSVSMTKKDLYITFPLVRDTKRRLLRKKQGDTGKEEGAARAIYLVSGNAYRPTSAHPSPPLSQIM